MKKDEPVVNHTLTVTGGTFVVKNGGIDVTDTLETSTDEASGKQTCLVPDGAEVTVTLDQTKVPEGMVFDLWSTGNFDLPLDQDYKAESITFTMNGDVDVAAQYRSADIEDGSDVVGPIIVGTAVVAGGALVGYTLGTDLVGKMWGLPYFPSNRSALAMMLWRMQASLCRNLRSSTPMLARKNRIWICSMLPAGPWSTTSCLT